ncbi:MAG: methylmalonyl-CoA/ethylmalonyl-CoA epimerase [Gaiellaceae bacterium]|nr:methylmalonyl-CoA/ethylmalonyl-CoA epimerase [Gaiellaceae bacterium]
MEVEKVDHVAIAVRSIPEALKLFVDTMGGTYQSGGDDDRIGIRIVHVQLAGFKLELIQPLREDSYLQRFLDKHGEGFHHMTIIVADVREAVVALEAAGYETVDPRFETPLWQEVFVRPKHGFGTLIQIVQTDRRWDQPFEGITLERVLAGDVVWIDDLPELRTP